MLINRSKQRCNISVALLLFSYWLHSGWFIYINNWPWSTEPLGMGLDGNAVRRLLLLRFACDPPTGEPLKIRLAGGWTAPRDRGYLSVHLWMRNPEMVNWSESLHGGTWYSHLWLRTRQRRRNLLGIPADCHVCLHIACVPMVNRK